MNDRQISYNAGYLLRGIAMLVILFVHSVNEYDFYSSTCSRLLMIPHWGAIACSLFFFMSGYGLFNSLSAKDTPYSIWKYLLTHLLKLLVPFILSFALTWAVIEILPFEITHVGENRLTNIFRLSMSNGTDMWFFKIIILNYLITTALFSIKTSSRTRIILLFAIHLLLILLCYAADVPGYWYISNCAFVLGAAMVTWSRIITSKKVMMLSVAVAAVYIVLSCLDINKTPVIILGNVGLCSIAAWCLAGHDIPDYRVITYIGKNSLYFYLFSIPVMTAIPGEGMNPLIYFVLNTLGTLLLTMFYLRKRFA